MLPRWLAWVLFVSSNDLYDYDRLDSYHKNPLFLAFATISQV